MRDLVAIAAFVLPLPLLGDTLGHWRFDEVGAAAGGSILSGVNFADVGANDAFVAGGNPLYSDDIPSTEIFDPITGRTLPNKFSYCFFDSNDYPAILILKPG